MQMNTLGTRIKHFRKAKKLSQAALANACGWSSQSRVGNYEADIREPSLDDLDRLANALGVTVPVLVGRQDLVSNVAEVGTSYATGRRQAPVISWVQAGEWNDIMDEFQPGHAEEWETVPDAASQYCFWLRVVGDSMTATAGISIPEGALILVDPEAPVVSGSLVVAKLIDSDQATFKRYIEDAGRKYLKPLNPAYPVIEINGNCRIVGVVKEAKIKL